MKGDFTNVSFDRAKHFSRVLKQQGRVTLDADDNEQTAILLHYLRTLTLDLVGPYAAPIVGGGFVLTADQKNLKLSPGRCYVDGLLVENETEYRVEDALWKKIKDEEQPYWLYLDVWEHHVTALEDDSIREKALGGPDTCTRAKVVWQVRAQKVEKEEEVPADGAKAEETVTKCAKQVKALSRVNPPGLTAQVDPDRKDKDPGVTSPSSKYRGMENQLYRVEIHQGGTVGGAPEPTFKWSRDNGSVAAAWLATAGNGLQVSRARGFKAGNWVELSDEASELQGKPGVLGKVTQVDGDTLSVEPDVGASLPDWKDLVNPRVRRWDQQRTEGIEWKDGAVMVTAAAWIDLEDGIQVRFTAGGEYRTGDYWLIPARVATGTIEWPDSIAVPPHGVEHHYAPLGFVSWQDSEGMVVKGCRCVFLPVSSCAKVLAERP